MNFPNGFSDLTDSCKKHWPVYTAAGGIICLYIGHRIVRHTRRERVQSKIRERGERASTHIQQIQKQISKDKVDSSITSLPFKELHARLQDGSLKAEDVWKSYIAKALEVNERTNAITDVIPSSKAEAQALDKKDASQRGLLHGIPISVKECVGIKGMDCTAGLAALIDIVRREDSILIQVLKSEGAVPFIKTNLAQAILSVASGNPVFGRTVSPFDKKRSPGGSSGGEGAIIGGGGSILGIGSDIGGSARIPASFCGISSIKPTLGRYSFRGSYELDQPLDGENIIGIVEGPMGQDVDALVQFIRAALSPKMFELDPTIPPIPFREEMFKDKKPLRIGFYTYDGCTCCVPSIVRAVTIAKKTLEKLGHTVVPYELYKVKEGLEEWFWPAVLGDNLSSLANLMEYDDTFEPIVEAVKFNQQPYLARLFWGNIREFTTHDPAGVGLMKRKANRTVSDWWRMNIGKNNYRATFINDMKAHDLDLLLGPATPCPALNHVLDGPMLPYVTYTCIYNLVNLPAGIVPVSHVTKEDVAKAKDPKSYKAETFFEKMLVEDSENSEGLPTGIQIAGLPFKEEMVLRVMLELQNALKQKK